MGGGTTGRMRVPSEVFGEVMAGLASGVAVVTARHDGGRPCGLAVTSISSYSASPPSVMFAVAHSSRSHAALVGAGEYAVHLLRADQEAVARTFAGKAEDKFADLDWDWEDGVPVLGGALAVLRCREAAAFVHGDHTIFVGEVEEARFGRGEPLLYLRRRMDWRVFAG